jgi:hypothetical protein
MTEACNMNAIQEILKVSRTKNAAHNITGMLCYDPKFFMQCLEGPKGVVNELYGDIVRDSRHTQITLLEYQDIEERTFGDWSMAFVRAKDLDAPVLRKFAGRGNPFALSSEQARDLVMEIVKQKREQMQDQMDNRPR